jgi:hypothetical protein
MYEKVRGTLVVIGGAEDKDDRCLILKRFVELAGGKQAKLVIVTTATVEPGVSGEVYCRLFRQLGAGIPRRRQAWRILSVLGPGLVAAPKSCNFASVS